MSAHTYWRINVTANNGGAYLSLNEIEFRAAVGGSDQCTGGTVLFSSQAGGTDNAATNAFDNDQSSKWTSNSTPTGYIGYQFASPVNVGQIAITATYPGQGSYAPKAFSLQYSDNGSDWMTIKELSTNETGWGTQETRLFSSYTASLSGNVTESLAITDWTVTAHRCDGTGGVLYRANISGSSYTLDYMPTDPMIVTLAAKVDYSWTSGRGAVVGDYVVASNPDSVPHLFKVTTAGTFAGTEASWNLSGTTTQGAAVLTYVAPLVDPVSIGPKIPTLP